MTFKPIPGYISYEINEQGEVRNSKTGKLLKCSPFNSSGHLNVSLRTGGRPFTRTVHSLVLETFVGPRPEGLVCRHLDGDVTNNSLSNLAYGSQSENMIDASRHGNKGTLTERQVRVIRGLHRVDPEQFTQVKLGEMFGVSTVAIHKVIRRQSYAWIE